MCGSLLSYGFLVWLFTHPGKRLNLALASLPSDMALISFSVFFLSLFCYVAIFWLLRLVALACGKMVALRRFKSKFGGNYFALSFACMNFIVALLYYRFRYNPEGMEKPWTEIRDRL